jgi:inositol-pentakisphosphate 2-kinase
VNEALEGLWAGWRASEGKWNNWRVFVDGKEVSPEDVSIFFTRMTFG